MKKALEADADLRHSSVPTAACVRATYPWHNLVSYKTAPYYVYPAMEEYNKIHRPVQLTPRNVRVEKYDEPNGTIEYYYITDKAANDKLWSLMTIKP